MLTKLKRTFMARDKFPDSVFVRHPRYSDALLTVIKGEKSTSYPSARIKYTEFWTQILVYFKGPDLLNLANKIPAPRTIPAKSSDRLLSIFREKGQRERLINMALDQCACVPPFALARRSISREYRNQIMQRRWAHILEAGKALNRNDRSLLGMIYAI